LIFVALQKFNPTMAKEFKRSTASSAKGRKPFGAKKAKSENSRDQAYHDKKKERGGNDDWHKEKSPEKKHRSVKGSGPTRREDQPSFQRDRDHGKPSDFNPGKKNRSFSNGNEFSSEKRRPPNKQATSKERPFKKEKSFTGNLYKKKKQANPYDLDESDFEYADDQQLEKPVPGKKAATQGGKKKTEAVSLKKEDGLIRLNKYISNSGICSRREADELIASGAVQVNGKTITEMGFKVKPSDVIKYGGQTLKKERMVYLILNKPKDYITTVDDPQKRKTVLELVRDACKERIYPVGRLDRSTTGLLMFTNNGELTKKLTHPKYGVRKIYHVELDKPLKKQDLEQIAQGLELEDGLIQVDEISYVGDGKDKSQVGIELHSGKNRIVRRIFEHLGYNVRKLDRVMFGPLTKKDLPRGRWRFLTPAEIGILNMISSD
jgi:23S rRNA pseudouridine2605 synthase